MIHVSESIVRRITDSFGSFCEYLAGTPAEKCALDVLNEVKAHEQVALLCKVLNKDPVEFLPGKRLLEIGSGFCIFVSVIRRDYGVDSYGIEPASEGFDTSFAIGQDILREYGHDPKIVKNVSGEALPWPDNYFDLVYSTNVLEHVDDPDKVVREILRVLKPGGYAQLVYPNYDSLFEGHYALPWIPHMSKKMAWAWVRLWGRDPVFLDTLNFLTEKDARRWAAFPELEAIDFGKSIFVERMSSNRFNSWAGLGLVKKWLSLLHKFRLTIFFTKTLLFCRAYTPIIFTCKKTPPEASFSATRRIQPMPASKRTL